MDLLCESTLPDAALGGFAVAVRDEMSARQGEPDQHRHRQQHQRQLQQQAGDEKGALLCLRQSEDLDDRYVGVAAFQPGLEPGLEPLLDLAPARRGLLEAWALV